MLAAVRSLVQTRTCANRQLLKAVQQSTWQKKWYSAQKQQQQTGFASAHIDARLSMALEAQLGISEPTELQKALFQSMLIERQNVLLRQTTGTGKTLGLLVSLLTYAMQPSSNTAVFVVPNRELALQIEGWADVLIRGAFGEHLRYRVLQRFVSGEGFEGEQKRVLRRHGVPKIILGTPRCLMEMKEALDGVAVGVLVVDEVDAVLKLPGRYASSKQVLLRKEKPTPGQVFVEWVLGVDTFALNAREMLADGMEQARMKKMRLAKTKDRKMRKAAEKSGGEKAVAEKCQGTSDGGSGGDTGGEKGSGRDVQLVVSSATANHRLRSLIGARSWVSQPLVVLRDAETISMPSGTQHYCLVIDNEETIRNITPRITSSNADDNDDGDVASQQPSSYSRHLELKAQVDKQNPWVADVLARSKEQQESIMQLMAEVASNVLRAMQPQGTTVLFVRSDANTRLFAGVLRSYGVVARDIMTRYEAKDDQARNEIPGDSAVFPVYLATEEAARGVDIPDAELVLILDVPKNISSYVHLSGRAGRFGRPGAVFTVVPVGKHGWYESKMQAIFSTLKITPQNAPFVE